MKNGKRRKRPHAGRSAAKAGRARRIRADDPQRDEEVLREKILRGEANEPSASAEPSRSEVAGDVRPGRIVAIEGRTVVVEPEDDGATVPCLLRGSTRVPHARANAVAVGDEVTYLASGETPYVLTEVLPRRSHLARIRRGREEQVICANVELAIVVASIAQPPFKARLVDRYAIAAAQGGLRPVVILNKIDLAPTARVGTLLAPYRELGLPALPTSAETGQGLAELTEILRDRVSVFSGQSGVGKSSLLNRLIPGLALRTAEVYGRLGKGRHTTSNSTLYRFPFGGAVVDTPGIRSFGLHEPTAEAVRSFFPEIREAAADCRFGDCRHDGEPGCALPAALAEGNVLPERLESYQLLMKEVAK